MYHRHDEKGLNWEPGGVRSGAGVCKSGVHLRIREPWFDGDSGEPWQARHQVADALKVHLAYRRSVALADISTAVDNVFVQTPQGYLLSNNSVLDGSQPEGRVPERHQDRRDDPGRSRPDRDQIDRGPPDPFRPFPSLIETGKSHPKTGLFPAVFQRFSDSFLGKFDGGFLAVFWRFSGGSTAVLPAVSQQFDAGFPTVFPAVSRQFSGGLPAVFRRFSGGFPTVLPVVSRRFCQQFSGGFPKVFRRFCQRFPAVLPTVSRRFSRRFANDAAPLDQPPSGSGVPLHPKETVGQFRTHFQACKPSIAP